MTSTTININELFKTAQQEGTISKQAVQSLNLGDISNQINQAMGIAANDVKAAEVILLTLLIDDSGSIRFTAGNTEAVREGYNSVLESLLSSKQKDSVLVHTRYLNGTVLCPYKPLDQCEKMDTHNYDPMGGTPLYDEIQGILGTVIAKVQEFSDNGVPCRAITLIMTDGADEHSVRIRRGEEGKLAIVVNDLLKMETHIIAALGVEQPGLDFRQVFGDIGIPDKWILTPKNSASEIRKALGVFSQSVIRASQNAASFSQAAIGGFTN